MTELLSRDQAVLGHPEADWLPEASQELQQEGALSRKG